MFQSLAERVGQRFARWLGRSLFFVPLEGGRGANQILVNRRDKEGGRFPAERWRVDMALTPEQHAEIASAYESAAADSFISAEQRAAFARKAELFRLLAKLAAKQAASVRQRAPSPAKGADMRREIFENIVKKRSSQPQAWRAGNTCACPGFDAARPQVAPVPARNQDLRALRALACSTQSLNSTQALAAAMGRGALH